MSPTDLSVNQLPVSRTELVELMRVYQAATERLQAAHQGLQAEVARLRLELKAKNEELARKTRLAALGQMAAGVAHEIRNPLGAIRLFAGILKRDLSDARHVGYAEKVLEAVRRMDRIVEEMLCLARTREPDLAPCPLAPIIDSALEATAPELDARGIEITRRDGHPSCRVRADGEQLRRVFVNIITNAAQAMARDGRLRIETDHVAPPPSAANGSHPRRVRHKRVRIRFTDTGPGVAPEMLDRIFDPFFTGREDGIGLGLALAHRVVESHGGRLGAENEPTGGATFTVTLPALEEADDGRD